MEGFTKSSYPNKLVNSIEDGYNFLAEYSNLNTVTAI